MSVAHRTRRMHEEEVRLFVREFETHYGHLFTDGLRQSLYAQVRDKEEGEAYALAEAAKRVAWNFGRVMHERENVVRQENEVADYNSGVVSPTAQGRFSSGVILSGEDPFANPEVMQGLNLAALHGGTTDQHTKIRNLNIPLVHRVAPNRLYVKTLERVSREVMMDVRDIRGAMHDLVGGKITPNVAENKARARNHDISFGRKSDHRVLRGAANVTSAMVSGLDYLLRAVALNGITARTDHTRDSRYERALQLQRRLNDASPFARSYGTSEGSIGLLADNDALEIGGGLISPEEMSLYFRDVMDLFREQLSAEDKEKKEILDKYEEAIKGKYKAFYDNMRNVTDKHDEDWGPFVAALFMVNPFMHFLILPQLGSFLTPFAHMGFPDAIGQILSSDQLGFIGDMNHALGLDTAVSWVFDNTPLVNDVLGLVSDFLQSGVGQGLESIIGPLLSPVGELAVAGYAAVKLMDNKRQKISELDAISDPLKADVEGLYKALDAEFKQREVRTKDGKKRSDVRADLKIRGFKTSYLDIKMAEFLSALFSACDGEEEDYVNNIADILGAFDQCHFPICRIDGTISYATLRELCLDTNSRKYYAADPRRFLELMNGQSVVDELDRTVADEKTKEDLKKKYLEHFKKARAAGRTTFCQLMARCDEKVAGLVVGDEARARTDIFAEVGGVGAVFGHGANTVKFLRDGDDELLHHLRMTYLTRHLFNAEFPTVGKFRDTTIPEAERAKMSREAEEGRLYFEQGFVRHAAERILHEDLDATRDKGRRDQAALLEKKLHDYYSGTLSVIPHSEQGVAHKPAAASPSPADIQMVNVIADLFSLNDGVARNNAEAIVALFDGQEIPICNQEGEINLVKLSDLFADPAFHNALDSNPGTVEFLLSGKAVLDRIEVMILSPEARDKLRAQCHDHLRELRQKYREVCYKLNIELDELLATSRGRLDFSRAHGGNELVACASDDDARDFVRDHPGHVVRDLRKTLISQIDDVGLQALVKTVDDNLHPPTVTRARGGRSTGLSGHPAIVGMGGAGLS